MLQIIKVAEARQWEKFFQIPLKLYSRDPLWTPLPERQMFNTRENPLAGHVQYECFMAIKDGRPVGRIAAITDSYLSEQKLGLFGCFETIDSPEVARQLLTAASASLVNRGKTKIQGPVTLNTTQTVGLLIDGFDVPPQAMMPYNPPYYANLLEQCGCTKLLDLYSYLWRPNYNRKTSQLKAVARRVSRIPGLIIRPLNLNEPWQEGKKLADIHNAAMTNQWGFVPMDQSEAAYFLASLRSYTDPALLIICEVAEKPVGICLMLPDNGPQLRASRRSALPALLSGLITPRSLRVGVLAVTPEYRRRGVAALLIDRAMENVLKRGYAHVELSLIMDRNKEMNSIITSATGSRILKTFRIYQKDIGG